MMKNNALNAFTKCLEWSNSHNMLMVHYLVHRQVVDSSEGSVTETSIAKKDFLMTSSLIEFACACFPTSNQT